MSPPPRNNVSNNRSKICGRRAFATRNPHGRPRLANKLASPNQEGRRTNFLLRKSERFALSKEAVLLLVSSLFPSTNPAKNCVSSALPAHALPEHEERRLLRFIQSPSSLRPSIHPEFRKMTDFTLCLAFVRLNSSLICARLSSPFYATLTSASLQLAHSSHSEPASD